MPHTTYLCPSPSTWCRHTDRPSAPQAALLRRLAQASEVQPKPRTPSRARDETARLCPAQPAKLGWLTTPQPKKGGPATFAPASCALLSHLQLAAGVLECQQLLLEAVVGADPGAYRSHVASGFMERNAVLPHEVANYRGGRPAHPRHAVYQHATCSHQAAAFAGCPSSMCFRPLAPQSTSCNGRGICQVIWWEMWEPQTRREHAHARHTENAPHCAVGRLTRLDALIDELKHGAKVAQQVLRNVVQHGHMHICES